MFFMSRSCKSNRPPQLIASYTADYRANYIFDYTDVNINNLLRKLRGLLCSGLCTYTADHGESW
jgi:hypothetical protein